MKKSLLKKLEKKARSAKPYKVEGEFIYIKKDRSLPRRCVLTNQRTTAKDKRAYKLTEHLDIYGSGSKKAIGLYVAAQEVGFDRRLLKKYNKVNVFYYMNAKDRFKYFIIKWLGVAIMITSLIAIVPLIDSKSVYVWVAPIITLVGVIVMLQYKHPIAVCLHESGYYRIEGCSPEFLRETKAEVDLKL